MAAMLLYISEKTTGGADPADHACVGWFAVVVTVAVGHSRRVFSWEIAMTDDHTDQPEITVEASGVSIVVSDAQSAQAALPFIEGALEHYLGTETVKKQSGTSKGGHEPITATCDHCGYTWQYTGKTRTGTTCPQCNNYARFDPPLEERDGR